jgi:hypothetical protein
MAAAVAISKWVLKRRDSVMPHLPSKSYHVQPVNLLLTLQGSPTSVCACV